MHTHRRQAITLSLSPICSYLHSPSGVSTTFVSSHTATKVSSSTRQPKSITIVYFHRRQELYMPTYIANTVLELLQRSESEDHRSRTPSLSRHFFPSHICILLYATRCSWVGTHTEAFLYVFLHSTSIFYIPLVSHSS